MSILSGSAFSPSGDDFHIDLGGESGQHLVAAKLGRPVFLKHKWLPGPRVPHDFSAARNCHLTHDLVNAGLPELEAVKKPSTNTSHLRPPLARAN